MFLAGPWQWPQDLFLMSRNSLRNSLDTNLEDIMLKEINQPQNDIGSHLDEVLRIIKFRKTEGRWVVSRAGGGRTGELVVNWDRVSVWKDGHPAVLQSWRWTVVAQQYDCT